jgi:hypothetical protein
MRDKGLKKSFHRGWELSFKDDQLFWSTAYWKRTPRAQSQNQKEGGGGESDSSTSAVSTPSIYRQRMVTVEILNPTAKSEGILVIRAIFSGVDTTEDVFFCLDS